MQLISWAHVEEYILKKVPAQLPLGANTQICFVIADGSSSVALRIPRVTDAALTRSAFSELKIAEKSIDSVVFVELSVIDPVLYRTFYNFSMEVAQLIISEYDDPMKAIEKSMQNWGHLLSHRLVLDENEQIGLLGELLFLQALIQSYGVNTERSWIGPLKERHDFRLVATEIEVKSTTTARRIHTIHSLGQLEASPKSTLFLLSLQFEMAGNAASGATLPERIQAIRFLLAGSIEHLDSFNSKLSKLGYLDHDAAIYCSRRKLRGLAELVPISSRFPRLSRAILDSHVPGGQGARILHAEYNVNVEGLGHAESTPEWDVILPNIIKLADLI